MLAYFSALSTNTMAVWLDATGRMTGRAGMARSASASESSLSLLDLARGSATRLSSDQGRNDSPVWSPDGTSVAFASDRDGPKNPFVKKVDEAAPEVPIYRSDVLFKNPEGGHPTISGSRSPRSTQPLSRTRLHAPRRRPETDREPSAQHLMGRRHARPAEVHHHSA